MDIKIDSGFNVLDFFWSYDNGLEAFCDSIKNRSDYGIGECLIEGIATVLTDDFQHGEDYVWDWLDDNHILERVVDKESNNVTMADILNEWQEYLDN